MLIGSSARVAPPADEHSDLDLIVITRDPARYLQQTDWLGACGPWAISFLERTAVADGWERRVLFEDGTDVDFAIFPPASLPALAQDPGVRDILRRGFRVLLDKDAVFAHWSVPATAVPSSPPARMDCEQLMHDFWYHAVWQARKLCRGELWVALDCHGHLVRLLLAMIEQHARVTRGADVDTWHRGRFLERWADPAIVMGLRGVFPHYEPADAWQALTATMVLFRQVATATMERLGHPYPAAADQAASRLVGDLARAQAP